MTTKSRPAPIRVPLSHGGKKGLILADQLRAVGYHNRGMYFASHGYTFLIVDVGGRGNSEGSLRPLIREVKDGYDAVEWLGKQPYFYNGKISIRCSRRRFQRNRFNSAAAIHMAR
jgi:predicted acyl esterase